MLPYAYCILIEVAQGSSDFRHRSVCNFFVDPRTDKILASNFSNDRIPFPAVLVRTQSSPFPCAPQVDTDHPQAGDPFSLLQLWRPRGPRSVTGGGGIVVPVDGPLRDTDRVPFFFKLV